jgi:putative phosphoesterase
MRIAVLSDSHDNIWKVEAALEHLQQADVVIHCGDLCSPFTLRQLADGIGEKPLHVVWGNNDGDKLLLARTAAERPWVHLHGAFAQLNLGGLAVAVNHYPEIAAPLALSGKFGLVCYGHNHQAKEERVGECLLLNPGELMGLMGRSSLALVDMESRSVEWVDL